MSSTYPPSLLAGLPTHRTSGIKIIYDEFFLKHRPPPRHPHPECPARVSTVRTELDGLEVGLARASLFLPPVPEDMVDQATKRLENRVGGADSLLVYMLDADPLGLID